uniref:Uncharacterized protein n=1 Tax=Anguilla anguilla TaxID=7936 RepID=A0A0E9TCU3_ANGAN
MTMRQKCRQSAFRSRCLHAYMFYHFRETALFVWSLPIFQL